ncbi:hypothetical protein M9H77_34930 [Catharanthus roseus]|uniref:Uncharacterized protein n=1 Tax=Catharanthus roseus TaxID=4058 RepID=A0ACB9ZR76_CATRO|nr:hypothetical protein M9H77_34930 [Catharanthus roseus]
MPELSSDGLVLGIRTLSVEPHCCITCSFKIGHRAALMCLDSLRLPSCARNPHVEEDPSEPTSDSEMIPEPEQGTPAVTGSMGTSVANTMPAAASPTPIPPVASVSSFPASLLRGGVREYDICETSMATRRNERVPVTGADEALERFLKFRPPEFYGDVEQEIKAELFLEQLNDIYDTLKYEDALRLPCHRWDSRLQLKPPHEQRWLIKRLYRGKQPLVQRRLHINVLDKDHGNLEISRDPVRGVDRGGCGPIGLRGHRIMLYGGVRPPMRLFVIERSYVVWLVFDYEMPELSSDGLVLGIRTLSVEPHCCITCSFKIGHRAALMCLDSLRLPSCARNPHVV